MKIKHITATFAALGLAACGQSNESRTMTGEELSAVQHVFYESKPLQSHTITCHDAKGRQTVNETIVTRQLNVSMPAKYNTVITDTAFDGQVNRRIQHVGGTCTIDSRPQR